MILTWLTVSLLSLWSRVLRTDSSLQSGELEQLWLWCEIIHYKRLVIGSQFGIDTPASNDWRMEADNLEIICLIFDIQY